MTIQTNSSFYYIEAINSENNLMNFIEPNKDNVELTATLLVRSYSLNDLATELERALNDSGLNTYTVTLDRNTRKYTISADDDVNLLVTTGSNSGLSVYSTIGFTSDKTGGDTYESDTEAGSEYKPQFKLQSYVDAINRVESIGASVNESGSGIIEIVTFGRRNFYEFNIKYITSLLRDKGSPIENNPNGEQDARDFLNFCIGKEILEFMPDRNDKNTFVRILLETTPESKQGVNFILKEIRGLNGYFETGRLEFRKV